MLLKVRNIKSNKYYIAIDKKYNNLPTTDKGIDNYLCGLEHYIFAQQIGDYPLQYEYDNEGIVFKNNHVYNVIWKNNTIIII